MERNKVFLQEGPISASLVNEIITSANQEDIGAHSIFLGQVRGDVIDKQKVLSIEYSAYDEMVNGEMNKIIDTVSERYEDLKRVYVIHSKGVVKAGEISLFVFVACGHRISSFRAVEDVVNLIKEKIPIWKKEHLDDKSYIWTENKS